MMIANTFRLLAMMLFIYLMCWTGLCCAQDRETETTDSANTITAPIPADERSRRAQGDESTGLFDSKGLVEQFGDELKEERTAALKEINRQRQETLTYLSQERKVTLIEMEKMGDRIVSNAISKSERLIDHLLIRILQIAGVLILAVCIVGFLSIRVIKRNKNQS